MSEYSFEISTLDKTALHLRNAETHMGKLVPEGHRVRTRIVVDFVPDVRATLRDDVREGRVPKPKGEIVNADTGKVVRSSDKMRKAIDFIDRAMTCNEACGSTCKAGRA